MHRSPVKVNQNHHPRHSHQAHHLEIRVPSNPLPMHCLHTQRPPLPMLPPSTPILQHSAHHSMRMHLLLSRGFPSISGVHLYFQDEDAMPYSLAFPLHHPCRSAYTHPLPTNNRHWDQVHRLDFGMLPSLMYLHPSNQECYPTVLHYWVLSLRADLADSNHPYTHLGMLVPMLWTPLEQPSSVALSRCTPNNQSPTTTALPRQAKSKSTIQNHYVLALPAMLVAHAAMPHSAAPIAVPFF